MTVSLFPFLLFTASKRNMSSPLGISKCKSFSHSSHTSLRTIRFAPEHITALPRLAVRIVNSWIAAYSAICNFSNKPTLPLPKRRESDSMRSGRMIRSGACSFPLGKVRLGSFAASGKTTSSSCNQTYSDVAA